MKINIGLGAIERLEKAGESDFWTIFVKNAKKSENGTLVKFLSGNVKL